MDTDVHPANDDATAAVDRLSVLPDELFALVMSHFNVRERYSLRPVSSTFKAKVDRSFADVRGLSFKLGYSEGGKSSAQPPSPVAVVVAVPPPPSSSEATESELSLELELCDGSDEHSAKRRRRGGSQANPTAAGAFVAFVTEERMDPSGAGRIVFEHTSEAAIRFGKALQLLRSMGGHLRSLHITHAHRSTAKRDSSNANQFMTAINSLLDVVLPGPGRLERVSLASCLLLADNACLLGALANKLLPLPDEAGSIVHYNGFCVCGNSHWRNASNSDTAGREPEACCSSQVLAGERLVALTLTTEASCDRSDIGDELRLTALTHLLAAFQPSMRRRIADLNTLNPEDHTPSLNDVIWRVRYIDLGWMRDGGRGTAALYALLQHTRLTLFRAPQLAHVDWRPLYVPPGFRANRAGLGRGVTLPVLADLRPAGWRLLLDTERQPILPTYEQQFHHHDHLTMEFPGPINVLVERPRCRRYRVHVDSREELVRLVHLLNINPEPHFGHWDPSWEEPRSVTQFLQYLQIHPNQEDEPLSAAAAAVRRFEVYCARGGGGGGGDGDNDGPFANAAVYLQRVLDACPNLARLDVDSLVWRCGLKLNALVYPPRVTEFVTARLLWSGVGHCAYVCEQMPLQRAVTIGVNKVAHDLVPSLAAIAKLQHLQSLRIEGNMRPGTLKAVEEQLLGAADDGGVRLHRPACLTNLIAVELVPEPDVSQTITCTHRFVRLLTSQCPRLQKVVLNSFLITDTAADYTLKSSQQLCALQHLRELHVEWQFKQQAGLTTVDRQQQLLESQRRRLFNVECLHALLANSPSIRSVRVPYACFRQANLIADALSRHSALRFVDLPLDINAGKGGIDLIILMQMLAADMPNRRHTTVVKVLNVVTPSSSADLYSIIERITTGIEQQHRELTFDASRRCPVALLHSSLTNFCAHLRTECVECRFRHSDIDKEHAQRTYRSLIICSRKNPGVKIVFYCMPTTLNTSA